MKSTGNYLKDEYIKVWSEFLVQNAATFIYLSGLFTLAYVDWRIGFGAFLIFAGFKVGSRG